MASRGLSISQKWAIQQRKRDQRLLEQLAEITAMVERIQQRLADACRAVELAEDPDTLYDAHEALYAAAKEVTTRA